MEIPTQKNALPSILGPSLLLLAFFTGATSQALAQTLEETIKLVPADNDEDDLFGHAVSIDGDLALIGAYADDSLNMDCGAAYVYRFDGQCWIEEVELLASDGSQGDHLGYSVALSDDLALVGAYNTADAWAGGIYVYRFDSSSQTWSEETQLVGPNPFGGDSFASSVAASGDVVLVGAPGDDASGTDVGAAYIFRYDSQTATWSQGLKLTASDGAAGDLFGHSVSLSGSAALIGASRDGDQGSWSGSAYVFRYDEGSQTWSQEAKLTAADGASYDEFGRAVSISGDLAVVGAPEDDDAGWSSGSAYLFGYDSQTASWSPGPKLAASDGGAYAYFGSAVSIAGDRALVGAYADDQKGYKAGAAYVYRAAGGPSPWAQEAKLVASEGDSNDVLGSAVSISGGRILLGAPSDEHSASFSGSAYLTDLEPASPGTLNEDRKILASDGGGGDKFGHAVAISGNLAILGAEQDAPAGTWSGSAYVGRYDTASKTWIEEAKLVASDADPEDFFGESVALSGDIAVVGAFQDEDNSQSGSAYVFRRDGASQTWSQEAKLLPSDGKLWDSFGIASAVSGTAVLVGAHQVDGSGSDSGSAYVFRYDLFTKQWSQEQKLVAADASSGDNFGRSVSLSGDVALVGAHRDFDGGVYSGSAYVFRYDPVAGQWNQEAKLLPSDGATGDQFGLSVSVFGDLAVVGAHWDDDLAADSGSVYVYRYDPLSLTWSEEAKLSAFDAAQDDWFGQSVSVSAEHLLVGSPGDDDAGSTSGSAYLYRWQCCCWTLKAKLLASDGAQHDGFGKAVSVSAGQALVGSVYDDSWRGSAYVFSEPAAGPLAISDVSPDRIDAVVVDGPGIVTLTGTGFLATIGIAVDGIALSSSMPAQFQVVSDTRIDFEMPQVTQVDMIDIVVSTATDSATGQIKVTPNDPPVLEMAPTAYTSTGTELLMGSRVGDLYVIALSPDNIPTVVPGLVSLDIGNSFTTLFILGGAFVGPEAYLEADLSLPPAAAGKTFYWQGAVWPAGQVFGEFETTNVEKQLIQF